MDPAQLLITVGSLVGIALVGAMAVVPTVMEARAASADPAPSPPAPAPPAPTTLPRRHPRRRQRAATGPAHLAA